MCQYIVGEIAYHAAAISAWEQLQFSPQIVKMLVEASSKQHDIMIYTDGSVTWDQPGWGFQVKQTGMTVHEDSGAQRVMNSTLTMVGWLVGCLMSQQHASVSQGRICSDSCTCCHTEIEVADQTSYLIQSQYTDIGPTSPSTEPTMPSAWQGSHWSANFEVTGMTQSGKTLTMEVEAVTHTIQWLAFQCDTQDTK